MNVILFCFSIIHQFLLQYFLFLNYYLVINLKESSVEISNKNKENWFISNLVTTHPKLEYYPFLLLIFF